MDCCGQSPKNPRRVSAHLLILWGGSKRGLVCVCSLFYLCMAERGAVKAPEDQALAHGRLAEQVALEPGLGRGMCQLG